MKPLSLVGGVLLVSLPIISLLPGCGGGSGSNTIPTPIPVPTSTTSPSPTATPITQATAIPTTAPPPTPRPTATSIPQPTPAPPLSGNFANLAYSGNGIGFGTSPFISTTVSIRKSGSQVIVSCPHNLSRGSAGTITLYLGSAIPLKEGQVIDLSASSKDWMSAFDGLFKNIGGQNNCTGVIRIQRSGDEATFNFENVVAYKSGSAAYSATFNGIVHVTLPPDLR